MAFAACLVLPGAATGFNGTVLRGFGTASVDGVKAVGEWEPAGRVDFSVNRSSSQGGGTVPATLYLMNDAANLYVGIQVHNATVGSSTAEVLFDNDHDNTTREEGEDDLYVNGVGEVSDGFVHQIAPNTFQIVDDLAYGGTNDVDEADADSTGYSFYEISHPLDSADNAHDFSVRTPMRLGFLVRFRHCAPSCASMSYYPSSSGLSEILVVSGSRIAPDTHITSGPKEGSTTNDPTPTFEFTGSDDAVQPQDLAFECNTDEGGWQACRNGTAVYVDDGRHTFSVRATDEMLNVDPTPAERIWTVDTTGPSRPVIRGKRSVRKDRRIVLRFSATDELAGGVRYRCAVDSRRLRRCPAVLRVKLRPGRHVVRVRALDRLGNESDLGAARITVLRR